MAINSYGAFQQPYQSPYPSQYSMPYLTPQDRLRAYETQYPQYGQTMQPVPQQSAQAPQAQSSVMSVSNEQQARDYPLDLSGAPMIFVMQDDSKIFAKRFNLSTGLSEFETYERATQAAPASAATATQDNSFLLGIVGNFSTQLETMSAEISAIKEAVLNGNQPNGNSKSVSGKKSADAAGNADGAGNGAVGK